MSKLLYTTTKNKLNRVITDDISDNEFYNSIVFVENDSTYGYGIAIHNQLYRNSSYYISYCASFPETEEDNTIYFTYDSEKID